MILELVFIRSGYFRFVHLSVLQTAYLSLCVKSNILFIRYIYYNVFVVCYIVNL